jgi:hypothetical protein
MAIQSRNETRRRLVSAIRATMTDPMKLTEKHVVEKAEEILGEARRLGYFRFKRHLQLGGSNPIKLCFANNGSIRYERQLGWAQFLRKSGGAFTGLHQGTHFEQIAQRQILSADGIEPWQRGSVAKRSPRRGVIGERRKL